MEIKLNFHACAVCIAQEVHHHAGLDLFEQWAQRQFVETLHDLLDAATPNAGAVVVVDHHAWHTVPAANLANLEFARLQQLNVLRRQADWLEFCAFFQHHQAVVVARGERGKRLAHFLALLLGQQLVQLQNARRLGAVLVDVGHRLFTSLGNAKGVALIRQGRQTCDAVAHQLQMPN